MTWGEEGGSIVDVLKDQRRVDDEGERVEGSGVSPSHFTERNLKSQGS